MFSLSVARWPKNSSPSGKHKGRYGPFFARFALVVCAALGTFFLAWLFVHPQTVHDPKDFAQDYLIGKAVLERQDPYQPLNQLGERYQTAGLTPSPSAHPPPFAVFCAFLALFSYPIAVLIWLAISVIALAVAAGLTFDLRGVNLLLVSLTLVAWEPIHTDLQLGQLMTVMLALTAAAWWFLRSEKDSYAGVALGITFCLKPILWPILIYLALRTRFKAVIVAGVTAGLANLIAMLAIGPGTVIRYYTQIGPTVSAIYRNDSFNFSLWSIGARVFSGTKGIFVNTSSTAPLIYAPSLALAVSVVCVLAALVLGMYLALKSREWFSLLLCVCILISPVAWWFYLGLLLIPFKALRQNASTVSTLLLVIGLAVPYVQSLWSAAPLAYLTLVPLYLAIARTSISHPAVC